MTTEKALREALQALVDVEDWRLRLVRLHEMGHGTDHMQHNAAVKKAWIGARAALSLPETVGEPVGYFQDHDGIHQQVQPTYKDCADVYPLYAAPPPQSQPVAWILKTGHGTKLVEVKPPCEVDLWRPLVYGDAAPPSQPAQGWKLVPEEPPLVCLRHGMADITPPCRKWCGSASCTPPTQAKPTNGEGA